MKHPAYILLLILLLLISPSFSGCDLPFFSEESTPTDDTEAGTSENDLLIAESDTPWDITGVAPDGKGIIRIPDGNTLGVRRLQAGLFSYDSLSAEQQILYAQMLIALWNRVDKVYLSASEETDLGDVYECVLNDHPEIFYATGYQTTKFSFAGNAVDFSFAPMYEYDWTEIQQRQKQIDEYVTTFLRTLPADADDYTKIKAAYEYILLHTDYIPSSPDDQNICSVFLYGQSVCQGYAKALQYLVQRMSIPTALIRGWAVPEGKAAEIHAWIAVYADGEWYHCDPTWGDTSYSQISGISPEAAVDYDYMLTSWDDLQPTHTITTAAPDCQSLTDNYYLREQAYFMAADLSAFGALVQRCVDGGKPCVALKCSDAAVYQEMCRLLFDEHKIHDYITKSPGGSISYSRSDHCHSIIIWR